MAKSTKSGKLRFFTLMLSMVLLISFSAVFLTACSDDDDADREKTTDTQTFPNGDFEYYSDNSGEYIIGTPDNWTSSTVSNGSGVSSNSSLSRAGIVSTDATQDFDDDTYDDYVTELDEDGYSDYGFDWSAFYYAYKNFVYYDSLDEDDDEDELEDAVYYTDVDSYYDVPGWDIFAAYLETEEGEEYLESVGLDPDDFSVTDSDDLLEDAIADKFIDYIQDINPGTYWSNDTDHETQDEDKGTNILMLHNYRTNGYGTAMQYASTSITLAAGTAASVSVWVKTSNLTYMNGEEITDSMRGAFIEITDALGGSSQTSLLVRGINTELQFENTETEDENNGWMQYTFYVRASSYSATTFTVNLGLGYQAAGTQTNYNEYVQGYAFFDELKYNVFDAKYWDDIIGGSYEKDLDGDGTVDTTPAVPGGHRTTLNTESYSDTFSFRAQNTTSLEEQVYSIDLDELYGQSAQFTLDDSADGNLTIEETSQGEGSKKTTASEYFEADDLINENDALYSGVYSDLSSLTDNIPTTETAVTEAFENYADLPFSSNIATGADSQILLLYSGSGAAYTATLENEELFTVDANQNLMISFWVKTSAMQGNTGGSVTLVDADSDYTIGSLDTTTLSTVDLKDDTNETEDIFDGWTQCFFYVTNGSESEDPLTFSLEFNFGPTSVTSNTIDSYVPGFVAFTAFEYTYLTNAQYDVISTGDYAVSVSLTGDEYSGEAVIDETYENDTTIETTVAQPSSYTGVTGGSYYVGGDEITESNTLNASSEDGGAGLVNRNYADAYLENLSTNKWLQVLLSIEYNVTISELLAGETDTYADYWSEIFGNDVTQPLIIAKTVTDSYGFIANSNSTISSSSYSMITVRVKLSAYTSAYVYLIDTEEPDISSDLFDEDDYSDYNTTLKHTTGLSYRYDEDGNLVNLDPDDDAFRSRQNTLLWLQDNGLWTTTKNGKKSDYYANLANYDSDDDGNLIDNDGTIIYYLNPDDNLYYRYYDYDDSEEYEVEVKDFTAAEEAGLIDLTGSVIQEPTSHSLYQKVTNDTSSVSDWIYIRFFIASGDESKSYRLELWSGDREGEEGSTTQDISNFVIFDIVSYGDLDEEGFTTRVEDRLDYIADAWGYEDTDDLLDDYIENPTQFNTDEGYTKNGVTASLSYFYYSLYDDDDYTPYDDDYTDDSDPYAEYVASDYDYALSYLKYSYTSTFGYECYDTYVDYSVSEISISAAVTNDDDDDDDDDSEFSVWLLVVSCILAAVLIFTLIALLVRRLLTFVRKKRVIRKKPSYSNKRARYIRKLKLEEQTADEEEEEDAELFSKEELYNETDTEEPPETLNEDDDDPDRES